jgi:hypothetical protein
MYQCNKLKVITRCLNLEHEKAEQANRCLQLESHQLEATLQEGQQLSLTLRDMLQDFQLRHTAKLAHVSFSVGQLWCFSCGWYHRQYRHEQYALCCDE